MLWVWHFIPKAMPWTTTQLNFLNLGKGLNQQFDGQINYYTADDPPYFFIKRKKLQKGGSQEKANGIKTLER